MQTSPNVISARKRIEPQRRLLLKFAAAHHSFDAQQTAVITAPDDEIPACAVPQAAQQHGQHQIAIRHPAAVAIAAQRDVQIVAQPARERNVPAMPEIGDAEGQVRAAEIDREMKAEQQRHADGHIGIAGKIEEDLHREGEDAAPRREASRMRAQVLKIGIGDLGELVGEGHLLGQAKRDQQARRAATSSWLGCFQANRSAKNSSARTMGPATNCGKKAMNSA